MPKWIGNRFGSIVPIAPGVEAPSAIYNIFDQYYSKQDSGWASPSGLTATGGAVSEYIDGSDIYRAHVFTSSGSFVVTALGTEPAALEYLVVAGGGGGGSRQGGGGGAGGLRSNFPGMPSPLKNPTNITATAGPTTYPIVIGAGAAGGSGDAQKGEDGTNSVLTYPGPNTITAHGGGGGGSGGGSPPYPALAGRNGGSGGGGAAWGPETGSGGNGNTPPFNPAQGTGGGAGGSNGSDNNRVAGGGGGFTASGTDGAPLLDPNVGAPGGDGISLNITGITTAYAGGGGGGVYASSEASPAKGNGGSSVGGQGNNENDSLNSYMHAVVSTGSGGGGGGGGPTGGAAGGQGSSGIVVIRYKIGSINTAKASGGLISFYGGKTIHVFNHSGTFQAPSPLNPSPLAVTYVVVGGGGAGAGPGGGGGAGQYITGPSTVPSGSSVSVQVGAGGASPYDPGADTGFDGTPSYFGTPITAGGGGGGGHYSASGRDGLSGSSGSGSGGGVGRDAPGDSAGTGSSPGGNPGGPWNAGGGGGGTGGSGGGGAGEAGDESAPGNAGDGGYGVQLHPDLRNPTAGYGDPGTYGGGTAPTPGGYWVAGGGGAGLHPPGNAGTGGSGGGARGIVAADASTPVPDNMSAQKNTGGGGGGSGGTGGTGPIGGRGGSGIVIVYYDT